MCVIILTIKLMVQILIVCNILLFKELSESVLVYGIYFKTSVDLKPLRISFHKIDGFIIILDGKIKRFIII